MDGINKNTLLMVFTIFRHGDRTPPFIDDQNKHLWPEGTGTLTKKGKIEAYELGEKYCRHYKDFLGADFNTMDVYVYSTDTERSLMSAECCMVGLLPTTEQNKWHPTHNWQPVPIHTRHKEDYPSRIAHHIKTLNDKVNVSGKNVFYPFEKFEEIVKSSQLDSQDEYE